MATVTHEFNSVNVHAVLVAAGFKNFRRDRCDCPYCAGGSHLTVSIQKGLYHCFRCGRGGSVRSLARQQGIELPPPRLRKADIPKQQFRVWLSNKCREMATLEYRLYLKLKWARVCLSYYPNHDAAWEVLRQWYDLEHRFRTFWGSATDKLGRYWLYRAWRNHAR
jgi:hypothetical protein